MTANDDLNKRVAERIQGELVAILPEEEIRQRVDNVIDNFFSPGVVTSYNGGKSYTPSQFEKLVVTELEKKANEVIKAIFNSPEWKVQISDDLTVTIGIALQKAMNISPDVLKDVTAAIIAKDRALYLTSILGNVLSTGYNNVDISNQYYSAVNNEYNKVFGDDKMTSMYVKDQNTNIIKNHEHDYMVIHPNVLAAHAQFGGDLRSMQAMYDRPGHLAKIKELEEQISLLKENQKCGCNYDDKEDICLWHLNNTYKGWFFTDEETGVHNWSSVKPLNGKDIRKATIEECLKYLTNPVFVRICGAIFDETNP